MVSIASLWSCVLISAVLVFVASSLGHSVLPFHRLDYGRLPNEDAVMDVLRRETIVPGDHIFPLAPSPKAVREPALHEKWKRGPAGWMTVLPKGGHSMGRTFALWFVYCAAVGTFTALFAGRALSPAAAPRDILLFAGFAAFGGHAFGYWPASIGYGRSWGTTVRFTVDALAYGRLKGGTFACAWLWPR